MPAEAARFRRRLRLRDRWFVGVVAGGLVVGTPVAIALSDPGSGSPRDGRCIATIETGFMGGQTRRYCGRAAVAFCRSPAVARRTELAAACRRLGAARSTRKP